MVVQNDGIKLSSGFSKLAGPGHQRFVRQSVFFFGDESLKVVNFYLALNLNNKGNKYEE